MPRGKKRSKAHPHSEKAKAVKNSEVFLQPFLVDKQSVHLFSYALFPLFFFVTGNFHANHTSFRSPFGECRKRNIHKSTVGFNNRRVIFNTVYCPKHIITLLIICLFYHTKRTPSTSYTIFFRYSKPFLMPSIQSSLPSYSMSICPSNPAFLSIATHCATGTSPDPTETPLR